MLNDNILIRDNESVKDALKKLNKSACKVLLVADGKKKLLGTISDGDVRRYLLAGKSLTDDIKEAYNRKPLCIQNKDFSKDKAREIFLKNKIELLPILDENNKLLDFVTWSQVFSDVVPPFIKKTINMPVVIMAGGKGTRLDPFTKILPKALIPIGDKPIVEIIIDEFKSYGIGDYYLTVNHKAKMIEAYFDNLEKDYQLHYIREDEFLGTAGSLKFLEGKIKNSAIVSNCDVIVKADFQEVINLHKKEKAFLTILSSIQHHKIPYGVVHFKVKGEVTEVVEKPEYTFAINTGVYVLSKDCLPFIPDKLYFDMTDLIKALIKAGKKVITYPVNEGNYIDVGQWEEYKKALDKVQF